MKFKNSDRLNHCISNTNNTRKYRLLQQYFDKVDRLPRSLPSCSRKRGLLLRKYSIPRFHFALALYFRYVRGSVIIRAAPFFANQFHIANLAEREREKRMRVLPICRENGKPQKKCVLQVRSVALRISSSFSCTRLMLF